MFRVGVFANVAGNIWLTPWDARNFPLEIEDRLVGGGPVVMSGTFFNIIADGFVQHTVKNRYETSRFVK